MSEPLPAAILATLAQGIPIIGAYPSGAAIAKGEAFEAAFTTMLLPPDLHELVPEDRMVHLG
jgi:hypothetical protein